MSLVRGLQHGSITPDGARCVIDRNSIFRAWAAAQRPTVTDTCDSRAASSSELDFLFCHEIASGRSSGLAAVEMAVRNKLFERYLTHSWLKRRLVVRPITHFTRNRRRCHHYPVSSRIQQPRPASTHTSLRTIWRINTHVFSLARCSFRHAVSSNYTQSFALAAPPSRSLFNAAYSEPHRIAISKLEIESDQPQRSLCATLCSVSLTAVPSTHSRKTIANPIFSYWTTIFKGTGNGTTLASLFVTFYISFETKYHGCRTTAGTRHSSTTSRNITTQPLWSKWLASSRPQIASCTQCSC